MSFPLSLHCFYHYWSGIHHQNLPGTSLTMSVGHRYCEDVVVCWIRMNCSSITQTNRLFFCCPSLQMPILLASAGVFLIWCFLGTSSQLDTVVWIILEFLQESHFIFCWSISYVSPHFILLTKFPYFQAEGVKRC